MTQATFKVCGKGKLLYAEKDSQLYYHRNVLWLYKNKKWKRLCAVPRSGKLSFLSRFSLFDRMLRLAPRCAAKLPTGDWLLSVHGGVFRVTPDGNAVWEHAYRRGMNNPLTFTAISGVETFDEGIAYGEYFGNSKRESMHIWLRHNDQWESVYEFPAGSIKHIHGIVPHKQRGCVYVLTGDEDEESAIWEFRDNFRTCRKLIGGTQSCRSCVAFPWRDSLVYATDTPLESNALFRLDLQSCQSEKLMDIPGSVIYGTQHEEDIIFATTVEPDSRIKGRRYLLTYRRGNGIADWRSHLYAGNPNVGFRHLAAISKDPLPMGLFQFGTFLFPPAFDGNLYAIGQSLIKYDGKTVRLHYD